MSDIRVINAKSLESKHRYFLECAKIHSREIPNGFLPTLGLNFLSSLYEFFSKSKYSFLLLAIENSKVVGFIAVSLHTKLFFRQYLWTQSYKNVYKIPISIFSQIFIRKIIEVLKYPFNDKARKYDFVSNSEIFNFCVNNSVQGLGVGQLLFSEAVSQLKDRQVKTLKIVTGQMQTGAQRFYHRSGAVLLHTITVHEGEDSMVFKYEVNGCKQ